ncbi:MAG: hypothetical protein IKH93_05460 [Bacteroidales bacterium]|nr:hypothetical protein [Bacteroidales bacterium]
MKGIIIALVVLCVIFMAVIAKLDIDNAELSANNTLLSRRLETSSEKLNQDQSLTVKDIEAAIKHCGYTPDTSNDFVSFKVKDKLIDIDITRLPVLGIVCDYTIDLDKWNFDLIKQAAHLMADELIMVKAIFINNEDNTILRFLVVAMDRNGISFRDNLQRYISILSEGNTVLKEKYHSLEAETSGPVILAKQLTSFRYEA